MALAPGTRLGPYEVTALLGVGGMGEVYRATDTNLGRAVAIKVLPEAVAQDGDRLARFDREARTLAALNHPHIAAIYGLERSSPGSGGAGGQAGTIALVMELVEGPTLADRIGQGPIPIDEALPIARQIAEALEAAHEQGIIHRDLKPANVKVRDDGTVKVLDFGLAKAMEPAGALATSQSLSPTITTPAMTQAGMILGTAAYMSPEQARGRTVDKRTDIWAFGVVLYEMLTGTRAFDSEDLSLTLADVMRAEPAWERLPADLSPSLVSVLRRCLRKDPKERLRDIGDVRLALDGAFEAGAVPGGGAAAATSGAFRAARWRVLATGVAGLLVGGLVATLAWMAGAPAALPEEVRHASMVLTTQDGTLAAVAENQVPALDGAGRVLVVRASGTNPWSRPAEAGVRPGRATDSTTRT
jgi:hypothetical protein